MRRRGGGGGFAVIIVWRVNLPQNVKIAGSGSELKYRNLEAEESKTELYAAVPGIRKSLLGVHAKQFGEKFHHLQRRLSRPTSRTSLYSSTDSLAAEASEGEGGARSRHSESSSAGPATPSGTGHTTNPLKSLTQVDGE
ncbi:unnamed protein product [Anisakis simplex]|uniref:Uncharacterized protein n=1 Tax=Anisakis simplex TaxID=6269 RepID=A0A0M3JHY1_ANISI|nr:unnamed protein product [Anisakis simplex]